MQRNSKSKNSNFTQIQKINTVNTSCNTALLPSCEYSGGPPPHFQVFRFFTKLKNATRCKHFTWPLPAARPRIRRRWQHCTTCHALRRVALCSQQHASKCGAHALERCVAIRCWPMMARSAQLVCLHHAASLLSHSAATSRRGETNCIMIDDAW